MSLQDYNFLSGFGDNKKAQGALAGGLLLGALITYIAMRP